MFLNLVVFAQDSPCNDSLYLQLKTISLDKMTQREYDYFLQKDAACNANQTNKITIQQQNESANNRVGTIIVLSIIITSISYLIGYAAISK